MTRDVPEERDLSHEPNGEDTKVLVGAEPYAQFSAWLEAELDKLEARWMKWAAPNAGEPRRKMPSR